jgi:hypothetical protein
MTALSALSRLLAAAALLTMIVIPVGQPRASAEPVAPTFLSLHIDSVTPDVVTTTSPPLVTVTGSVTNVGDRTVRDVMVRLEHAAAVTTSANLRTDLTGPVDQFQGVADFVTVSPEMAEGQRVPFTLSYPIRSADRPALGIDKPGIYPVLVNVNGTPDYGIPARLDDARLLLPVVGVPAEPSTRPPDPLNDAGGIVPPDTSRPTRVTMLWPLADKPRLVAGAPGGTTPVRLKDDELASALAGGGRLDTLLSAVDFATSPAVDPGGQVRSATCLVVDPDLLVTVNAMTSGYAVNDDSTAGPNSATHPGKGQDAAVDWLGRLKTLAQRMCVTSSVYAQADLAALQRVGDPGLASAATHDAPDVVDQILGVQSARGATIVGDGPLTDPALRLLSSEGAPTVAIAAAPYVAGDPASGVAPKIDVNPRRYTPQVVVAPFDPAVSAALAGAGTDPSSPSYLDPAMTVPLEHDSATARRLDAVASLLWRGLRPEVEPRSQILLPPLVWNLASDDAAAIFTALATSIQSGLAVPRPLSAVIEESGSARSAPDQALPANSPKSQFDDDVTKEVSAVTGRLWALTAALTDDPRTGLTGGQYTAPLREDMLRALSQSEPPSTRNGLATQRVATVDSTVNDLVGAVSIVNPGDSYTLATEHSPLPLALRNDLPVTIRVRLAVDAPPGMTVGDMGEIDLPPGYLPLKVPIEVRFTQKVAIDVSLLTVDGLPLGDPVRLSVHSNAYGKVLFFLTLSAGAVLVLLAGRRLWHRFRGQPDRADLDRPRRRGVDERSRRGQTSGEEETDPAGSDPLDVAIAHAPETP